jgi:rod shape-determining protein MreC
LGNIFKNRFFIILLIVICVLTLSTIVLNLTGHGSVVADITNLILTPFRRFADVLTDSFSGFAAYFTEFNRMKEEIGELSERLAAAEALNEDTRRLQEQNDMLYSFFKLQSERPHYSFQPARIIASSPGNIRFSLTIDKGALHGVELDMPVIAAVGAEKYAIVGYVGEVGLMSSRVVPFIRTNASVAAYIRRTGETGIVEGVFELEQRGLCRLAHLSRETLPEPGDRIWIYPEDLYIGEVISAESDPFSQTMTALIEPAVNFYEIRDVMVILEFELLEVTL